MGVKLFYGKFYNSDRLFYGTLSRAATVSYSGVDVFEMWKTNPCKLANTLLFAPEAHLAERLLPLT